MDLYVEHQSCKPCRDILKRTEAILKQSFQRTQPSRNQRTHFGQTDKKGFRSDQGGGSNELSLCHQFLKISPLPNVSPNPNKWEHERSRSRRLLIAFQNYSNDEVHHHNSYDQGVGHLKGSIFNGKAMETAVFCTWIL